MPTGSDYIESVRKYAPSASVEVVDRIVRHLGIALQSRDASLVSCSDATERNRVRDKWLKKKLGLADSDQELDAAVMEICDRMKDQRSKCRVCFYYLLAEKYDKLSEI